MTGTNDRAEWPLRPTLLAVIGAAAAVIVHQLVDQPRGVEPSAARLSMGVFVGIFAGLVAFTLERVRPLWSLGFAIVGASVVGLITWSSGPMRAWDAGEGWRLTCAFLAVAIAAPLFQAARDEGRARFPYAEVHGHAWTNVVVFFAAWAFAGIAVGLGWLIAALFRLIGVRALYDLMDADWFLALLVGAALGGAIGLLRERDRVVRTMLTVVLVVLRVLAPVLAVFLSAFLVFLPFTGLGALWNATRSTSPVVLGCMIVALILANAVFGQDESDGARSPVLRLAARVLAFTLLPLALIAAVSLGLRIVQHGLSVDRLWALMFVAVATAYGLGYLVSVLRAGWVERLRASNLRLAFGLCAVALFLALPIVGFNRIATDDQVARLESGRVDPDTFDWAALRFDFGESGKAAVARLARSGTPAIRLAANDALRSPNRYEMGDERRRREQGAGLDARLRVVPANAQVPPALREAIVRSGLCEIKQRCVLIIEPTTALLVTQWPRSAQSLVQVQPLALKDGRWSAVAQLSTLRDSDTGVDLTRGRVEVREVRRRQVFVDGRPVGTVID